MKVYSESLFLFAIRLEKTLKKILKDECGLDVRRSRFLYQKYTYPIKIVFFESEAKLGYFDPHSYQIGLNANLIYNCKEDVIHNILRHELAHYIQFIQTKHPVLPHGNEFKQICLDFGWGECISKASFNVELANEKSEGNLALEKMMAKVKKLLELASSDNSHEAQLATVKANELILKYNLKFFKETQEPKTYVCELLKARRKNAKLSCIYDILTHFLVKPILIYGQSQVAIEACGSRESIELAKYVSQFLDEELENLWKSQKSLKGQREKNSFFMGIARGYQEKMDQVHKQFNSEQSQNLILINSQLNDMYQQIYRSTSHTYSKAKTSSNAYSKGLSAGKNLSIQPVVKNKNKKQNQLTWNR